MIDFDAVSIDANTRLIGDIIGLHGADYLNVSDVSASQSATFTTDGLVNFFGVVSAPTITVSSSNIEIFDGGSLGVFGVTNLITLNAISNDQPIVIGDSGEGGEGDGGGRYVLATPTSKRQPWSSTRSAAAKAARPTFISTTLGSTEVRRPEAACAP